MGNPPTAASDMYRAAILAEVAGYGQTTDAHHITAPAEGVLGAARAIRLALADAGLSACFLFSFSGNLPLVIGPQRQDSKYNRHQSNCCNRTVANKPYPCLSLLLNGDADFQIFSFGYRIKNW